MQLLGIIDWLLEITNDALDVILLWVGLTALIAYTVSFFYKNFKKLRAKKIDAEIGEILYQSFILLAADAFLVIIFWWLPSLTVKLVDWLPVTIRWLEFLLATIGIAYLFGHEYGERRWLVSSLGHVGVIFFGWMVDRWIGILFLSTPVILAYYAALNRLAMVVLPTSNPEDPYEKKQRFKVLAAFTWGFQLPDYVVSGHAWKKPDRRIPGDFTLDLPFPGLVWTKSHQVVGITGGTQFKRVDGPGVVFTGKLERPFQIIDLRNQLRSSEIDVVSKDGIHFKANVFAAFRVDPDAWDEQTHDTIGAINPLLKGADQPSYMEGSFPYSHLRVKALLGSISPSSLNDDTLIYWDRWVLSVVEDMARKVISQKRLNELWKPAKDKKEANALEIIAQEIKDEIFIKLRSVGILLLAARVANFSFPKSEGDVDEISKQQIASWGSEWERKKIEVLSTAQAESERIQQEARAYAQSLLLNSIAEGLQRAEEIHPNLSRYVIEMRLLSALQDYIYIGPSDGEETIDNVKIRDLRSYIRERQEYYSSKDRREHKP